jgi:hypothetical protein
MASATPRRRSRGDLGPVAHDLRYASASQTQNCYSDGCMARPERGSFSNLVQRTKGKMAVRKSREPIRLAPLARVSSGNVRLAGNALAASRRDAIRYLFEIVYGSPPEEEWGGKGGTVVGISARLDIPANSARVVTSILHELVAVAQNKMGPHEYGSGRAGNYDAQAKSRHGRPALIVDYSAEGNIVCCAMESGVGLGQATVRVNQFRENCTPRRPPVSYKCVQGYVSR